MRKMCVNFTDFQVFNKYCEGVKLNQSFKIFQYKKNNLK